MAEEAEAPAPAPAAVEEVEMSVLDALKEVCQHTKESSRKGFLLSS